MSACISSLEGSEDLLAPKMDSVDNLRLVVNLRFVTDLSGRSDLLAPKMDSVVNLRFVTDLSGRSDAR